MVRKGAPQREGLTKLAKLDQPQPEKNLSDRNTLACLASPSVTKKKRFTTLPLGGPCQSSKVLLRDGQEDEANGG
jgi:hypothetical protein